MEHMVSQNPKYDGKNNFKKYFVRELNGKDIGSRNRYGMLAINSDKLHILVNEFIDSKSLVDLLLCLGTRNRDFDFSVRKV